MHAEREESASASLWVWGVLLALAAFALPIWWYAAHPGLAVQTPDLRPRFVPPGEEVAAVVSAFVVKPGYMLLSLALILVLRRRKEPDLRALKHGMMAFLFGESACACNYLFFGHAALADYLHSVGMAASAGFILYVLLEGIDGRVLHYGTVDRPCALAPLCPACAKRSDAPCGLRRAILAALAATAIVALMPLGMPIRSMADSTVIYGTAYTYVHPAAYQVFELRFCPAYALVLVAAAFGALLLGRTKHLRLAKALAAAGAGLLAFGVFRAIITRTFGGNLLWPTFWEEATEFIAIAASAWVLFVFRLRLLMGHAAERPQPAPAAQLGDRGGSAASS